MAHWLEELEEYDFETANRLGKVHGNADALSCFPQMDCQTDISVCISFVASTNFLPVYSPQKI